MSSSRENRKRRHDLSEAVGVDNDMVEAERRATVRKHMKDTKAKEREAAIERRKDKEGI